MIWLLIGWLVVGVISYAIHIYREEKYKNTDPKRNRYFPWSVFVLGCLFASFLGPILLIIDDGDKSDWGDGDFNI